MFADRFRPLLTAAAIAAIAGCASNDATLGSDHAAGTGSAAAAPVATTKGSAVSESKAAEARKPGTYAVVSGKQTDIPKVAMGDPATVRRIVDEGKNRNKVMDHITYLTQQIGPRLTGSSNAEKANRWAMEQFAKWGLTDSELFKWGEIPVRFDRGPSTGRIVAARPGSEGEFRTVREMEFTTQAWGAGTKGPVRGSVIRMPATEEDYEAVKDKLAGSWILIRASQPGRRGVGGFAGGTGARMRQFAEFRKKWAGGETTEPVKAEEPKAAAIAAEPAAPPSDPSLTRFEGTATGGRIQADGGFPVILEVNLTDPAKVTGNFGFPNYRVGPLKDGTFNAETGELKFTWEGPGGDAQYTLKIDGDTFKGERKLGDDGGVMTYTGKKATAIAAAPAPAEPAEPEKPKGPSIEEQVLKAGPAGFISASSDERVRTGGSGGWRELTMETLPQDVEVQVRQSDYDYMNSRLADGGSVMAEFDLAHKFMAGPIPTYNTVAEIKGTTWPDEVVIVSAHLDSWNGPGSQGCTDNGTGSSVTLEAARILMAAKAKPKRTIRFILWTGEEQGLLGSREYVKVLKDSGKLDKVSAVFVDDGGTNYEGGLHCVEAQTEYLAAATAPINGVFYSATDKKALEVNVQPGARMGGGISGGSSDHASFLSQGVPGFFWDEVGRADYGFGWHTQNDKLALAIPEYLMQSSTCAAVTAYNLACAPTLLPRPTAGSEEPAPRPRRNREGGRAGGGGAGGN